MGASSQSAKVVAPLTGRLSSWKEIAAFFEKDVRTVRRWEAERHLPVHRPPGRARGSVFVYVSELEAWLRESDHRKAGSQEAVDSGQSAPRETAPEAGTVATPAEVVPRAAAPADRGFRLMPAWLMAAWFRPRWFRPRWFTLLPGVAMVLCVALVAPRHKTIHRASPQRAPGGFNRANRQSSDPLAEDLYLRGLYFWNLRTGPSLTQSLDLFTQAIVRDPHFALAYAGLADSYLLLRQYGNLSDAQAYPRAYAASRQALALDDASPEAHRTHAFLLNYWIWDFPAAEEEFRRAIAIDPNDALTHHWYATSLYSAGRFQDAMKEIDIARRLQPESPAILANRGLLMTPLNADAALAYLLQLEKANPASAQVHADIASIELNRAEYPEYLAEERQAVELSGDRTAVDVQTHARRAFARGGPEAMMRAIAEETGALADRGRGNAMIAASFYLRLKDTERTLHYLDLACARRESAFRTIQYDPAFRVLDANPRFQTLLVRLNTPLNESAALALNPPSVANP